MPKMHGATPARIIQAKSNRHKHSADSAFSNLNNGGGKGAAIACWTSATNGRSRPASLSVKHSTFTGNGGRGPSVIHFHDYCRLEKVEINDQKKTAGPPVSASNSYDLLYSDNTIFYSISATQTKQSRPLNDTDDYPLHKGKLLSIDDNFIRHLTQVCVTS
jgi:hypothetical protein